MQQIRHQEAIPDTDIFPIVEESVDLAEPQPPVLPVHVLSTQLPLPVQDASRQALHLRRLFVVGVFSVLYVLAIAVFYTQGLIEGATLAAAGVAISVAIGTFYAIFASGANRKVADRNLTLPITICGFAIMLWLTYAAPATRHIFTPFSFLIIAFGMYRLAQRALLLLSTAALIGYLGVIGLQYMQKYDISSLKLALLHWFVLALTLPGFVLATGRVRRLHNALFRAGMKIRNIEEHARRDQLTGCYNRRYIVAVLEAQKRLADETGSDLCLAVIDLDHFKRINDEIGHLGGDDVLRTFAQVAQSNVRQSDVFGRYGGEEFLLVLPQTPLLAALNTAERIREQVENYSWHEQLQRPVTISIGLTQYIPGESVLDLFSRTDTALYLAKRGGRNQVVVEEPTVELWQAEGDGPA